MIKTAELTGAQLDYWTARAEGVPAPQLFFYQTPYTAETVCGRHVLNGFPVAVRYSTDWAQGGPLIEKYRVRFDANLGAGWYASVETGFAETGDTPLQSICRAVVRAAFGDEVEEAGV